jgi:DNA processing protein
VMEALPERPATVRVRFPSGFAEASPSWSAPPESPPDMVHARHSVALLLGPEPTLVDDLVRRCQFSASTVMAVLLELELAGRLETMTGHRVALLDQTRIS